MASFSADLYSPSWYRAPLRLQSAADIDGSASSASVYATIASANFLALKRSLPRDLAAAADAASTGFFVVSGFSAAPSSSSSDSPSSSTMATRFIPLRSTLSVTIRRAFAQSRRTSVFVGSMSSAAVRSSNAAASSPATPVSSLAAPRRMSALKNLGSRSSARSQSAMASCHRACFISAAALLLCTAGESGSSLSERVYASMADRNSLALNSSLPFSFSRMATHFFSFSEAPRMAWSVRWTSTLAPGTERSSSLASAGRVRLPMPPSIASAFAISSGDGIRPALSSRFVVVRCGRRRPRVLDGDVRGAANGRAPRAAADERRLVLIARVRLFGDLGPHLQIAEEIVGVGVGLGARRGIVGESLGAQRGHPRLDHRGRLREPLLSAG